MSKYYISHLRMLHLVDEIVLNIDEDAKNYTHIMGISRGGLIPATHISHVLNLPLAITSYSAPAGKGSGTRNTFHWQDDKHVPIDRSSIVLVVDDIIDSGFTMAHVVEELAVHAGSVDAAVLVNKRNSQMEKVNCRVYFGEEVSEDSPWVVFPWERRE